MRTLPLLAAFVAIASLSCAHAQADSVIVNPAGGRTLIDPATGKERFVPDLLQPWQSEPIKLHPPRKHGVAHRTSADGLASQTPATDSYASAPEAAAPRKHRRTAQASSDAASAPQTALPAESFGSVTPEAAPARKAKPKRTAAAAPPSPPQKSAPVSGFSDFTDLISQQPSAPPPPAKKNAAPPPPAAQVVTATPREPPRTEKPAQRAASLEPQKPSKPRIVAGAKKDSITFAPNATDPSTSAVGAIRSLAGTLSTALTDSGARVQLMAYAGMRGEKSSDTRRLSLKRALVIRQLLIDDGVPSERIDVFALGGADDDGPLDRVDVFVKG